MPYTQTFTLDFSTSPDYDDLHLNGQLLNLDKTPYGGVIMNGFTYWEDGFYQYTGELPDTFRGVLKVYCNKHPDSMLYIAINPPDPTKNYVPEIQNAVNSIKETVSQINTSGPTTRNSEYNRVTVYF